MISYFQPCMGDGSFYGRDWLRTRILEVRTIRDAQLGASLKGADIPISLVRVHCALPIVHALRPVHFSRCVTLWVGAWQVMDGWTAEYGYRGFEGILATWLDLNHDGIRARCHVLDLAPRGHFTMSADKLGHMVKSALRRYDVDWDTDCFVDRVLCLVCDNAADGVATAKELGVPCFRCLVHTCNLAFKEPDVMVSAQLLVLTLALALYCPHKFAFSIVHLFPLSCLQERMTPMIQPALDVVSYFRLSAKRMLLLSLSAGAHADIAAHEEPLPVAGVDGYTEADVAQAAAEREEHKHAAVVEYLNAMVEANDEVAKVGVVGWGRC
jgi:hypothetical protein